MSHTDIDSKSENFSNVLRFKVRLYLVLGLLALLLGLSGYFIMKDEMQTSRIRNLIADVSLKLNEAFIEEESSNVTKLETTSETTSSVKIYINNKSSNPENPSSNTNKHYEPRTEYKVPSEYDSSIEDEEFIPYTETEEYKEWKEDFEKKQREIEERQKDVKESQAQFCEEHPDLCEIFD